MNMTYTPFPLIQLEETDSTNRYLTQKCDTEKVDEYTTVCADYQTAGKGQRGNRWESERGKNLMFSLVLYPVFLEARRQFLLSQIAALAVKEELEEWATDISIKWPNDIYWQEKKICGLLIENELASNGIARCIIGIGLNINQEIFRSDAPNPVSLKQITGCDHDRQQILNGLLRRLQAYYQGLQGTEADRIAANIQTRYAQALFRREGWHRYEDTHGTFTARLLRVEADGRFVLQDEEGKERGYLFKEVQYVL